MGGNNETLWPNNSTEILHDTNEHVTFPSNFLAGSIYLVTMIPLAAMYVVCIQAMRCTPDLARNSCYILMCTLGIIDIIQLTGNGIFSGLHAIIGPNVSYGLNKFMGALANGLGWNASLVLMNVLTFNRFLHMVFPAIKDKLFGSVIKTYVWAGLTVFYGVIWFVFSLTPGVSVVFKIETLSWSFEGKDAGLMGRLELISNIFNFTCMVLFYIGIIIKLKQLTAGVQFGDEEIARKERRLILQAFLICFITGFDFSLWHIFPHLTVAARQLGFLSTFMWAFNAACNPIIYISLNPTIASNVKQIMAGGFVSGTVHPNPQQMSVEETFSITHRSSTDLIIQFTAQI